MALKMATKGAAKTALSIVPGGKLVASGAAAIGKVASQQIYKRSPAARNQWWKNHLSSGNWQRNRDKAELEFDLLDHDDSGTINKEEFLLSIPGMYHPDSEEAKLLRERAVEKEKRQRESKTNIQSVEEINEKLSEEKRVLDESIQKNEQQQDQTAGGKKRRKTLNIAFAFLITIESGSKPLGHAILISTPNNAPQKIREFATLLPSPINVKTISLKFRNSSLIVI